MVMMEKVWPNNLGRHSPPQLWRSLHKVFADAPLDLDLELVNDDLVGFFNSVPQSRIIQVAQK